MYKILCLLEMHIICFENKFKIMQLTFLFVKGTENFKKLDHHISFLSYQHLKQLIFISYNYTVYNKCIL